MAKTWRKKMKLSIYAKKYRTEHERFTKIYQVISTILRIFITSFLCMIGYKVLWILETISLFQLDRKNYHDATYVQELQSKTMGSLKL